MSIKYLPEMRRAMQEIYLGIFFVCVHQGGTALVWDYRRICLINTCWEAAVEVELLPPV